MRKLLAVCFVSGVLIGAPMPQAGRRTVWNGVYTEAQAEKGQSEFRSNCASCHGADLGGRSAPALQGDFFMDHWREDNVGSLYKFIKNTMPPVEHPGLSEGQIVGIVSYILQSNGFPSGSAELAANVVDGIQIEGQNGPQPIPNRSLVQIVGCLRS